MIVKFHARGRGGGSGPVDYLLGKDRQREGARVLQGKPEEVRELIDASPYAKKYTSGVLSFAEKDLPPGQREKLMASFERVLMPGLDKDQYSVLWVEHGDKGRVELNFLIPNTELLTGKRLQPYFDRADRPRIDAWQTIVNARLGLHDPNAPENKRTLVTPNSLPKTKQEAAQAITDGLMMLCQSGEVKTRQDVIEALTASGFDVVRTTKSSISLADPDGGRNLRLKGAIYEQSFEFGEGLQREIERASDRYREHAEARVQRAREVCQRGIGLKRADNEQRHRRPHAEPERDAGYAPAERAAAGVEDVDLRHSVAAADFRRELERPVVHGAAYQPERGGNTGAERHAVEAGDEDMGHRIPGRGERPVPGVAEGDDRGHGLDVRGRESEAPRGEAGTGVNQDDGAGNTIAERVRAATAGLFEKAGRMGERLRGIASDVWEYARGQREAEPGSGGLEQSRGALERAGEALEPVVQRHEIAVQAERLRVEQVQQQRQKELELVKERHYPGPTL
jgi:hypothetical protein